MEKAGFSCAPLLLLLTPNTFLNSQQILISDFKEGGEEIW